MKNLYCFSFVLGVLGMVVMGGGRGSAETHKMTTGSTFESAIFEKTVSKGVIAPGETVMYTFFVVNGDSENSLQFDFSDVMPQGFNRVSDSLRISGDLAQEGTPNIYGDASYLFISGIEILPAGQMTLMVDVAVDEALALGAYHNQAEMLDIRSRSTTKLSDWPNSPDENDPTPVQVLQLQPLVFIPFVTAPFVTAPFVTAGN